MWPRSQFSQPCHERASAGISSTSPPEQENQMSENRIRAVVVGGGYAGTLAANRLQQNPDLDISLVNARPEFVQRLRLHQFATRTGDATADYGTLLGERVRLVVDSVTRIDTADRVVRLASGGALRYDYVIYAVGSTAALPPSVHGAAEH